MDAIAAAPARRHRSAGLAALLLCLALTLSLYGRALALGWCCDDTQILWHALQYPPQRYFADPPAWRALVPFSLTPWLSLAYDIDLALFGLAPRGHYLHHLLAIAVAAWLLYALARRAMPARFALAAAVLFLVGVPVAQASQTLMVRHYVEGLVALLLALWLTQRRLDGGGPATAAGAALAFAVAATAKEIYLPLGLAALLLPAPDARQRWRAVWPMLLVMALYVPWRIHMLGEWLGGYTPAGALSGSGTPRLGQFAGVPALLFAQPVWAVAGCAVLAVAGRHLGPRAWAAQGAVAVLLLAPLVPLTVFPGLAAGSERYVLVPWAALSLALALWAARGAADSPRWAEPLLWGLLAALGLSAWQLSQRSLNETLAMHREYDAHYRLLIDGDVRDVLLASPQVVDWFVEGALALRPTAGRSGAAPTVVADEAELDALDRRGRRLWHYDGGSGALVDAAPGVDARLADWRGRLTESALSVHLRHDSTSGALSWRIEPAAGARFALVAAGARIAVPFASGTLRIGKPLPGCFRIRRDDAAGRIAYTPWLRLPMVRGADAQLDWQGTSLDLEALRASPRCSP